jgi:hypothetical protein
MSDITLINAPGGIGAWAAVETGLNPKGCKEAGEEAACTSAIGGGAAVNPAQEYIWTFTVLSTNSTPNATGHIKYMYATKRPEQEG